MSQMKTPLKGATEPRLHSPYLKGPNRGEEISQLADSIGLPLLPWQRFCISDMTAVDDAGMFRRRSNLLLTSRQQGKTHLARMMMLGHMFLFDSPNVLIMSSNRSMALDTFRQVAYAIEGSADLSRQVKQIRYANGTESIELKNGHRLDVVAATRDGSRGRSASFLYIDELREISEEGYRAATPTTRAKVNSQALYTSNAGDAFSTVLNDLRERALSNPPETFGYYEYSAPAFARIDDRSAWAYANPALGYLFDESVLAEAVSTQPIETTKTEMLCQWISSTASPWPHMSVEESGDSYRMPLNEADAETAMLSTKVDIVAKLVQAGFSPADASRLVGIKVAHTGAAPVTVQQQNAAEDDTEKREVIQPIINVTVPTPEARTRRVERDESGNITAIVEE